jgi:putative ABC transport system ATP-binding protein
LVIEPLLVLGDEPTGSLDSKTSQEILALLQRAASSAGRTVVIVTHDSGAAACAQRVVRLVDGVLEGKVGARLEATEAV